MWFQGQPVKPRRFPTVLLSPGVLSSILSTQLYKALGDPGLTRAYHGRCKDIKVDSSAEFFDFGGIHDIDDSNENVIRQRNPGHNHNHGDVETVCTID